MSGFYGADTEQVRTHRELMRDRARTLGELRERLDPMVMDESIWRGTDADSFRSTWASRTASLFDQVSGDVTARSDELERHAEEQDEASGADGSSTSSGGDGRGTGDGSDKGSGPSLWERITAGTEIYNALQGAFAKGKKIWDIASDIRSASRSIGNSQDIFQLAAGTWQYGKKMTDAAFSTGKEFSGLASSLLGKIGVPTGFGTKNLFGWVDDVGSWAGKSMPYLAKAAPYVGKALPVLDVAFGVDQMVDGIKNGSTFDTVTGGASALGGGLMLAGGALSATGAGVVVGGPLLAAGAVISGGAALANVGKAVYDNWDTISDTASKAWSATSDAVTGGIEKAGDAISDGWDNVTGAFGF